MWECPKCNKGGVPYKRTGMCKACAIKRKERAKQQKELLYQIGDLDKLLDVLRIVDTYMYNKYMARLNTYINAVE